MTDHINKYLENALSKKQFPEEELVELCENTVSLLIEEPTVPTLSSPITICGDIHGQFYDLLRLFHIGGILPQTRYIFLGDYVDRGRYSLECLTLMMCLKLKYPDQITLLRGNHESRQISHNYGFFDECMKRYGNTLVWSKCMEVFDYLPIAAVIDEDVFCVHGGLSPDLRTVDQIRMLEHHKEVPSSGAFADLMWSDPDQYTHGWSPSQRGAGHIFGEDATQEFLHTNNMNLVCRAHQLVSEGYRYAFSDQSLVTVWSAPNYAYRCGNAAAIMQLYPDGTRHFVMFDEVPETERTIPPIATVPYFM